MLKFKGVDIGSRLRMHFDCLSVCVHVCMYACVGLYVYMCTFVCVFLRFAHLTTKNKQGAKFAVGLFFLFFYFVEPGMGFS